MADEANNLPAGEPRQSEPPREAKCRQPSLLFGKGRSEFDMGGGRGPRKMEPHEFLSWFFSRDGH